MDPQQAADEAHQLIDRSARDWWRLAELTWHQINTGQSRARWAATLGVSPQTVNRWFQLWDRYGPVPEPDRPSYAEAWRLVVHDER